MITESYDSSEFQIASLEDEIQALYRLCEVAWSQSYNAVTLFEFPLWSRAYIYRCI